jgi:hypothetical protein
MRAYSVDQIIKAMKLKGYKVFNSQNHDLNIVGIRSAEMQANKFDDLLVVFYRQGDSWCVNYFPCTTDPGTYWLENPMTGLGTAILKAGQYRGVFQIGKHQNRYKALVQRKPVTVIRDPDRDTTLDLGSTIEETGFFGINLHCAGWKKQSLMVDKWSAGCQVVANWWDFMILLALCDAGAAAHGNSFTYTLLEEQDFGVIR